MIQCELIEKRKSIRFFDKNKVLEESEVCSCVEAAIKAPSSHNSQPWRFRIITSKEQIQYISTLLPNNSWIRLAPVVVIVGMVKSTGIERQKNYLALGAAIENMLLEAQQRGIATCWIGECLEKGFEEMLQWPFEYEIVSMVAMGYKRDYKVGEVVRRSVEEVLI